PRWRTPPLGVLSVPPQPSPRKRGEGVGCVGGGSGARAVEGDPAMSETIELNGRRYRNPQRPTVVICVDGCDPEYLERGIPDGIFPTIGSFRREGYVGTADAVVPTFTNPNNVSIVTGAPPSVHGIAGN